MRGGRFEYGLHGFKMVNHLLSKREVTWPYAQVPRRLGAGTPLTVLWFAPLARLHPVLGKNACEPGSIKRGVFCRCRDSKLEERDFQEA